MVQIRKVLPLVGVLASIAVAAPLSAQAPTKIGYLDSRRVIQAAPGAEQASQELGRFDAQINTLADSARVMIEQYAQQQNTLSPEARQQREAQIAQRQQQFQIRADSIQRVALERQNQLMPPIMTRVREAISAFRTEQGYAILFDVASDAMVSADTTLDVTEQVIARLRQGAGGQ